MYAAARAWIVRSLLNKDGLMTLSDDEVETICTRTDGMVFDGPAECH